MENDRKGKVKAGKKRELANVKNTLKKVGKSAVPTTLKLAASLPEHGKGMPVKQKDLVGDVSLQSQHPAQALYSDVHIVCLCKVLFSIAF